MTAPRSRTDKNTIDNSYLESLVGYNARRASLVIIGTVMQHMGVHDLRIVDFSILSLVAHNPGITSRQLSNQLNLLPPNLVGMVNALEKRQLIERKPHPDDGRALGLHLTEPGASLMAEAEQTIERLEIEATAALTAAERKTLIRLLLKIYRP
jgi:DNA-binding MarR family transcriptional regulator